VTDDGDDLPLPGFKQDRAYLGNRKRRAATPADESGETVIANAIEPLEQNLLAAFQRNTGEPNGARVPAGTKGQPRRSG
jgi:hypothetical protein